ncbi:TetR/AcrR family transcriptional regulator [Microlunatus elymi]|uniref:TetR/AcrR family transcriptional regulator n=1 Tax=Microlunatus elymi TaxID=2596828 RepID=UPI00143CCCFE|nr:TetR/AcrR family transcriptional regulator [Microlunatus elymi]
MPRATALPPDERRSQILDAAEPLLRVHGRKVSTREIAQAAEVAEGTIFRVFDSKEDLINQTIVRAIRAERTVAQLEEIDPDLDLEDTLVAVAQVLRERLRQTFELLRSIGPPANATEQDRQAFHDYMVDQNRLITAAVTQLIGPDQDQLVLTLDQTVQLLTTLTMTVSHPLLSRAHELSHLSDDPRALVDLLLHGALIDSTRTRQSFDHRSADPAPMDISAWASAPAS